MINAWARLIRAQSRWRRHVCQPVPWYGALAFRSPHAVEPEGAFVGLAACPTNSVPEWRIVNVIDRNSPGRWAG
jgi:hypothetical protein